MKILVQLAHTIHAQDKSRMRVVYLVTLVIIVRILVLQLQRVNAMPDSTV